MGEKSNRIIEMIGEGMKAQDTKELLNFYKQTSCYTDLGFYTKFARKLPNDIKTLCLLQRHQIIHPFDLYDEEIRKEKTIFMAI